MITTGAVQARSTRFAEAIIQPPRCRNVALTADNRATLTHHLERLDDLFGAAEALAPYPRHRLRRRTEIASTTWGRYAAGDHNRL
ncbi:hypothetical protein [Saccharothrix stipae]